MATTLYRKYRPQTFAEVVGQNHIKTTLQNELEKDKIAHAYLFSGPRGLGKTTMARLFAKAVNCLTRKSGQSEPCNQCNSCQEVITGRSLDVIEIDAASHTGVDNVRENIIENSRFTPTSRKFKVFIIDEVHMLSTSAFNALLKTLEEPPEHAIFILATTEIHKVPETIVSRCQHFDFRKVSSEEVIKRLAGIISKEGKKVDKQVVESIAYIGQGCLRDAESLLGQILSLSDKEITLEQAELVLPRSQFDSALKFVNLLIKKDSAAAISLINGLVEDGVDLEKFTSDLIEVLRKIMLVKVSASLIAFSTNLGKDLEKQLSKLAEDIELNLLVRALEIFISKRQEIKYAAIPQLPLELAVVEIVGDESSNNNQNPPGLALPIIKTKSLKLKNPEVKQAVAKPVEKAISQLTPAKNSKVSLDQIKKKWNDVMLGLKDYNQSLASTMKISQPSNIKENTLEISLNHRFHQQRLNEPKNRIVLEEVLEKIFKEKIIIEVIVDEKLAIKPPEAEEIKDEENSTESIDGLLKAFGGEVVK